MQQVDEILKRHEGQCVVVIVVPAGQQAVRHLKSRNRRVEWSRELEAELHSVPGVVTAELISAEGSRLAS